MVINITDKICNNYSGDINITNQLNNVAEDTLCDTAKFLKRNLDLVYTREILSYHRVRSWLPLHISI